MRPGREIDTRIAKEVFGHEVWAQNKVLFEKAAKGDRPLRQYTKELEWAWEVAEAMKITLIPVTDGEWFAFTSPKSEEGWDSPKLVLEYLDGGDFSTCGASTGKDVPLVICQAALKAVEKRSLLSAKSESQSKTLPPGDQESHAGESRTEMKSQIDESLQVSPEAITH